MPYALPAMCLDISSAEAQLGQVHATSFSFSVCNIVYAHGSPHIIEKKSREKSSLPDQTMISGMEYIPVYDDYPYITLKVKYIKHMYIKGW